MKKLWAPWRVEYIKRGKEKECIFCKAALSKEDETNLLLYRGKEAFVILNRFPYNNGHLMVAPYAHKSELKFLTPSEIFEIVQLWKLSIEVLKRYASPQGFNIGMNFGTSAGAGITMHLHTHIVPRWNGDTNFMPVLADTKVISEHLQSTYQKLKKIWNEIGSSI